MKDQDQLSTPHDDSPTPEPGTWIIRRRRTKRHPDQMRLPLNDLDDDVDVTRLSDTEFRTLLRSDDDLDVLLGERPDPNLASSFGAPLTEEQRQEVLRELDRTVEEMIAEEEKRR